MKSIVFTHAPDIDGMGSAILLKLIDENNDIVFCENFSTNKLIQEYFINNKLNEYDNIYICDVVIDEITADIIFKSGLNVRLFDHHKSGLNINKYDFATVVISNEKGMTCGTSLFYKYLIDNFNYEILNTDIIREFVELVRQYDTWEWITKYNNNDANKLNYLFNIYGKDIFVDKFVKTLKNNDKLFSDSDKVVLISEQNRIDNYIKDISKNIQIKEVLGYKALIVFADLYRNEIAEYFKSRKDIDFVMIVNFMRRSISYRTSKENVDVSDIANNFGGKGHKASAGSPLNENTYNDILNNILK